MRNLTFVMVGITVALLVIAYSQKNGNHILGLRLGIRMMMNLAPVVIAAFLMTGLMQAMIPERIITELLGARAGLKGLVIAVGAGIITPGGPFVSFPIAYSLLKSGASLGTTVCYITAWGFWGGGSLFYEAGIMGGRFLAIRFGLGIFMPILLGAASNLVNAFIKARLI